MNKKKYVIRQQPIPYMLVKNYFSEDDIEHMFRELRFLTPKMTFQDGKDLPSKDHKKNTEKTTTRLRNRCVNTLVEMENSLDCLELIFSKDYLRTED